MPFNPNRVRASINSRADLPPAPLAIPVHVAPNLKIAACNYAKAVTRMQAANTAAFKAEQKAALALKDFKEFSAQYDAAKAEYNKYIQI